MPPKLPKFAVKMCSMSRTKSPVVPKTITTSDLKQQRRAQQRKVHIEQERQKKLEKRKAMEIEQQERANEEFERIAQANTVRDDKKQNVINNINEIDDILNSIKDSSETKIKQPKIEAVMKAKSIARKALKNIGLKHSEEELDIEVKASKRVLKISQKIQASSTIEELNICLGELNIARLRKAQEKFRVRDERKDFITGAKTPRAASILASNRALPQKRYKKSSKSESNVLGSQEGNKAFGKYEAQTPYGPIWIRLEGQDISNAERMIYYDSDCNKAMRYTDIASNLDTALCKYKSKNPSFSNETISEKFVGPMIDYISQKITFSQKDRGQDLLNKLKIPTKPVYLSDLGDKQKQAAAVLCGILLFSESHIMRNPTGGKFERESLKKVQRLIAKGEEQPFLKFDKVYSNKNGLYTPAHDNSDDRLTGGRLQARFTIQNGKIDSDWLKARYKGIKEKKYEDIKKIIDESIKSLQALQEVLQQEKYSKPPYNAFKNKVTAVLEFWQNMLDVKANDINNEFIDKKLKSATEIKNELDKEILKQKQELTAEQIEYNRLLGILNKSKSTPKVVPDAEFREILPKEKFENMLINNSHQMIKPGLPTQTEEAKTMQQQIGQKEFWGKWNSIKPKLSKIAFYNTTLAALKGTKKVKVEDMPESLQKDLKKLIYKEDIKELFD